MRIFASERYSLLTLLTTALIAPGCADSPSDGELPIESTAATPAATPTFAKQSVPIKGHFREGWEQTVVLPETRATSGETVRLWVEGGLLYVRRELSTGELDWQFILCHIHEGVLPEIRVKDKLQFFEVSYLDRRYFIRETSEFLRCLREPGVTTGLFAKDDILGADSQSRGYGSCRPIGVFLSGWEDADWFFVASGASDQTWAAVVRLNPVEFKKRGYGFQGGGVGMASMFHGDTWVNDDGEFLVVSRTLPASYRWMKEQQAKQDAILSGAELPAIDATAWLNTDGAKTWETLKGKVVLVDFWGTWCGPCVAKLPQTQTLHETYADRGLVALGIHSQQGGDECAAFLEEHGYTFPVAVDSSRTAEAFAIEAWPTYFLIDRTGKMVRGFVHQPPSSEEIEALLEQPADERTPSS